MVAELKERFDREELEKRTHSLHACALVARSWVTRSGLHLFCCIALGSDLRTRRFLSSLTLSPSLGKFVETLQMRPNNDDERSCGWIFRALSTLPPLLPHLRELAFFELPDLHPACFALLSRFRTVQSVVLRWLNRQSLREITQLLSWFPQLRRLHVQFCEWKLPGRYYSGKQHKVIALDVNLSPTDRVRGMSLLEWAMASGLTGTLASLRVSSNVAGSVLDRLLETCSTLRELHFDLWEQDGEWLWIAILANAYLSESQNMRFPFLQAILHSNVWLCMDSQNGSFLSSSVFLSLHQIPSSAFGLIPYSAQKWVLSKRYPRVSGKRLISRYATPNSPTSKVSNFLNRLKNPLKILIRFFTKYCLNFMSAGSSGIEVIVKVCELNMNCVDVSLF